MIRKSTGIMNLKDLVICIVDSFIFTFFITSSFSMSSQILPFHLEGDKLDNGMQVVLVHNDEPERITMRDVNPGVGSSSSRTR